ncbi:glycoside hydrolase family 28 protein [Undibacterium sp. TS12]|uniref:glycoside hydrolase family 28 protein n=1 Tax=Undibacterium sp. TS12 TaxID=2908202 RepID=UPI001F4C77AF|nr:glycoside hydrolase family 28 protein [Undibacterium sp. TS12]MCH8619768.1 glycoside hydrolase family 28 protein [Undibacterium sp. TS12]
MKQEHNRQRRRLLRNTAGVLLAGGVGPQTWASASAIDAPWLEAQAIIDRVSRPLSFKAQDYVITEFGAVSCKLVTITAQVSSDTEKSEQAPLNTPAPGSTDCRPAITAAISACNKEGGGRVVIPAGNWYCAGPMVLLSNVHVYLKTGAHIYFSTNPLDYAKYGEYDCGKNGKLVISRWQGNDCLNYSPLVYAYGQDNIALTGEDWTSIINGQGGVPFEQGAGSWWDWKGRKRQGVNPAFTEIAVNPNNGSDLASIVPGLDPVKQKLIQGEGDSWRSDSRYLPALSEAGVAVAKRVFGIGHYLRPCMIELIGCSNVLLQGYQASNSPFWVHHPVNCRNLHINRVNMDSMGPNSDGFDPESCDGVLVDHCTFNTGDDCIAIKSGKNLDTNLGPTKNIVIQNCIMNSGHGAVTLGSEMAGGIENIYAQHLEFRNINWAKDALNTAIRMKTNMNRGGYLRNFYLRDIAIPNGVQTRPRFYKPLPGGDEAFKSVASGAGAIITIDCDYAPADDSVRTRPPMVSNVQISNVRVGNVNTGDGSYSCYQAMVILGPVASSYNGPAGKVISALRDISISDCDFGTTRNKKDIWYVHNVSKLSLNKVSINGKLYTETISG